MLYGQIVLRNCGFAIGADHAGPYALTTDWGFA